MVTLADSAGHFTYTPNTSEPDCSTVPGNPWTPLVLSSPSFLLEGPPLCCLLTLPVRAFVPKACHTCHFLVSFDQPRGRDLPCRMHPAQPGRISSKCLPGTEVAYFFSLTTTIPGCISGSVHCLGLKLWGHLAHALFSSSTWFLYVTLHSTLTPPAPSFAPR